MLWCSAWVFTAVPLRHQTTVREKLRFPSGAAAASVIATLHAAACVEEEGREGWRSSVGGGVRWKCKDEEEKGEEQEGCLAV